MNTQLLHRPAADCSVSADTVGAELLHLARASIEHGLVHERPLAVDYGELPRGLADIAATFTTLRIEGRLRGCCGTLDAVRPLAGDVARSAFQAAFRDVRFEPVGPHELEAIRLEVSVLSPLEPMPVSREADLLGRLVPGIDGLVIIAEGRRATFLPKVWEMLPDSRQFVRGLKAKCGLPETYWSEQIEFRRYRTTSYAEPSIS